MERLNEHDMTKKMMDVIRGQKLIKEEETDELQPNGSTAKDISFVKGQEEFDNTAKALRQIDGGAKLLSFKVYISSSPATYAEIEFSIPSGFNFQCSTKTDREFSISIPSDAGKTKKIYLDESLLSNMAKLRGFYLNWYKEWTEKLATDTEYQIN
jgi:hypothetical protein